MKKFRNLRPKIHYTPPNMWMNDPNGMYYENGNYHLFYQKDPTDVVVKGNLHWGHAVSRDLISWEEQPIALFPDELGVIFSGSCVYDSMNMSGYGSEENPAVIAMFTSHGECEQQSIAYSTDQVHFEKSYCNPVITNPGLTDFRDPKMFYNEKKGGYTAVLAATDKADFYFTRNFKDWEKTGEFTIKEDFVHGIWECPDMIKMDFNGEEKWVFILSTTAPAEEDGAKTHYFIGDFDGDKFILTQKLNEARYVDFCRDNYAGVSFQNCERPIFMSWAMNWAYAFAVQTGDNYNGQMTLARELKLDEVDGEIVLKSKPLGLEKYSSTAIETGAVTHLTEDTFVVTLNGCGNCEIVLTNEIGEELKFGIYEEEIVLNREKAGDTDFNDVFKSKAFSIAKMKRPSSDEYDITLIFDVSILEVFAFDGIVAGSATVYPQKPYTKMTVSGDVNIKIYYI